MFCLGFRLFLLETKENDGVRINKVLKKVLGLGDDVVIIGWELTGDGEDTQGGYKVGGEAADLG